VCDTLRTIALSAADAVLQMHYCAAYDSTLQPPGKGGIPTNNWMRVSLAAWLSVSLALGCLAKAEL